MSDTGINGLKKLVGIPALATIRQPVFHSCVLYLTCSFLPPAIAGCREKKCFCNIMCIPYLCNPNKEFFFEWLWESRKKRDVITKKITSWQKKLPAL